MRKSWLSLLLSFDGRLNRAKFWLLPLVPLLPLIVFGIIAAIVLNEATGRGAGPALVLIVLGAPLLVFAILVSAAVTVRRLHDRDRSGHWTWLYLGVPWAMSIVDLARGAMGTYSIPGLIGGIVSLAYIVDCGILKGSPDANSYGEPPVTSKSKAEA